MADTIATVVMCLYGAAFGLFLAEVLPPPRWFCRLCDRFNEWLEN